MNLTNTTAVPVTAAPYPPEVRAAYSGLIRRYPTARVEVARIGSKYLVQAKVAGVLVAHELVYTHQARRAELLAEILGETDSVPPRSSLYEAEGEPRIDSQWDEREAG